MNKFLTAACAAILLSTTALAKDKKVVIELPKTITVTCSDRVQPGTVVLSNPPKFSCADYDVVTRVIGTGITVGPDANVNRITAALRHVTRRNEFKVTKKDGVETHDNGRTIVRWRDNDNSNNHNSRNTTETRSLDDFYGNRSKYEKWLTETGPRGMEDKFPGTTRNIKWFNELAPIQVSDDPSGRCSGWINLNDILSGKCGRVKVQLP